MLGWEFPPGISGGLGTACFGLTRALAREGVEIVFVVPHLEGGEDRRFAELLECDASTAEEGLPAARPGPRTAATLSSRSLEVLALDSPLRPYESRAGYARNRARGCGLRGGYGPDLLDEVARYARAVERIAAHEPFDVIHAHDWMTYPAGLRLRERTNKPLVCHVHACEYDRAGEAADARIREVEQLGLDGADRIVCVSRYAARVLTTHYRVDRRKLRVVHNGLFPRKLGAGVARRKSARAPVVLFLGRITFQKGPMYFLEAARRVLGVDPDVRFVMCGDGDLLPRMVEHAVHLGIAPSVQFTGFLEGDDVERMFAGVDLYVMPSVSEPFGITPLEAIARDVPVIVSRQSGVAEVLDGCLKVDYWDVDDLAEKILSVLHDPRMRRLLVERARAELRRLRWDHSAHDVLGIYGEVCA